jgi:hypothetical protein
MKWLLIMALYTGGHGGTHAIHTEWFPTLRSCQAGSVIIQEMKNFNVYVEKQVCKDMSEFELSDEEYAKRKALAKLNPEEKKALGIK